MFNLDLSVDQENLERQGLEVRDIEASLNTDSYSVGFFDGLNGYQPTHPEQHSYWQGYQIGNREYWAAELSVEIPTEF